MNVTSQRNLWRRAVCSRAFCIAALATIAGLAAAQTPTTPTPSGPLPLNAAPSPASPPQPATGFIGTLEQWMQNGVATVGAGFGAVVGVIGGHAGETARGMTDEAATVAKGAADVARDTAATVTRLPSAAFISGREQCTLAPNGAPDCRNAAVSMCRVQGYSGGNSIAFETAEKCPPPARVSGRPPQGDCTLEHFVTRAVCQ